MPLEHCIANEDDEEAVDEFEYGIDDGVVLQLPLNDEINAPTVVVDPERCPLSAANLLVFQQRVRPLKLSDPENEYVPRLHYALQVIDKLNAIQA
jgi:hypothetical protein